MQTNLAVSPLLKQLKAETQDNHNRIEKVSCMKRLFAKDYTINEYRACLERMFGFYDAIEPIIYHYLGDQLRASFKFRSKIEPLKQDLTQLGLSQRDIDMLPRCPMDTSINSLAQSLGVWYVLEGSTLGGQVISRHLGQQFGDSVMQPLRFHSGYGEQTRTYWMDFCQVIEAQIDFDDNQKVHEIVGSAKLTFDYLTDWLGQEVGQSALATTACGHVLA